MAMFDRSIAVRCYRGEKKEGSQGRETGSREEREGKLSISCDKAQLIAIFIRIRMHLLRPSRTFVTASPSRVELPNLNTQLAYTYINIVYVCVWVCLCMGYINIFSVIETKRAPSQQTHIKVVDCLLFHSLWFVLLCFAFCCLLCASWFHRIYTQLKAKRSKREVERNSQR